MKCPHCTVAFHEHWATHNIGNDAESSNWLVHCLVCPSCEKLVVKLSPNNPKVGGLNPVIVRPAHAVRPIPADVPAPYSIDFRESCAVLAISPKASAALSRRLLQHILVDKGGAKKNASLVAQIEELLPKLPGHLQDLHAIRNVGNFAAHPSKDTNTGDIVEVEPGEADWLLDIIESLLDFYFVQPATRRRHVIELNKKLVAAGKAELPVP